MPEKIIAKTASNGQVVDLAEHSRSVLRACDLLFGQCDSATHLRTSWLRFFGLDVNADALPFLNHLRLACLFHDLGKANKGFQRAIRRQGPQVVRHEHLSALLLATEPFKKWFDEAKSISPPVITSAIAGHHLKAALAAFGQCLDEGESPIELAINSAEVRELLALAAQVMKMGRLDHEQLPSQWSRAQIREASKDLKREMRHWPGQDERLRNLALATKSALIASDAAASAVVRKGLSLDRWLPQCFAHSPLTHKWVDDNIIQPRIHDIEGRTQRAFIWQDFQKAAAKLGPRALVISPCGSGKTLAAWNWVRAQLQTRPVSRAIFLYPTRATATEGFRDYVSWAGGESSALMHSTSDYDLEGMFSNPDDARAGEKYQAVEGMYALGYWPKQVFSATVDSFLAFMRNQYASLCMLPVFCDSIVVIDEVHSFTNDMFTALERFLRTFDLPVLCMTATLPNDRLSVLRDDCGMTVFPSDKATFHDLERQANTARYRIQKRDDADAALEQARESLQDGKKLLWVVNTVDRCQETVGGLARALPDMRIICYHSRFRLADRKRRHEEVIHQFRETSGPIALVTTQVCEMSLDIDADVLASEIAPVPSLIQRMGRCCRRPDPNRCDGLVMLYPADGDRPYKPEEIRQGASFVAEMAKNGGIHSQADLAAYLKQMNITSPFASDGYVGFLDNAMFVSSRDEAFREGDDYTVEAVLDMDVEEYLRRRNSRDASAAGFVLPVPRRQARDDSRLGRLCVASASHYDKFTGFHKNEVKHG